MAEALLSVNARECFESLAVSIGKYILFAPKIANDVKESQLLVAGTSPTGFDAKAEADNRT